MWFRPTRAGVRIPPGALRAIGIVIITLPCHGRDAGLIPASPSVYRRFFQVRDMIGILIAILLAALAYWVCGALGLPAIIGVIAAILVLLGGVGYGGGWYGGPRRW